MGRWWHELWPQVLAVSFLVGVLGNLTASALLGTPVVWHLHVKLNRHHAERLAQAEEHHQAVMSALGTHAEAVGGLRDDLGRFVRAVNTGMGGGP